MTTLSEGLFALQNIWGADGRLLTYWVPLLAIPVGLALLAVPTRWSIVTRFRPHGGQTGPHGVVPGGVLFCFFWGGRLYLC